MFWPLVLAVERCAEALLCWSWWRRWHQAGARYYHYRRRDNQAPECPPEVDTSPVQAPQKEVMDVVWSRLEPLLPPTQRVGRPYAHERRQVLDAIVYVKHTGCGWRNLPSRFPPWQTVYAQLVRWREGGIWNTIWSKLNKPPVTDEVQL